MNLDLLNDMQRSAVEKVDGPMLILAGAGSGKTRVITHRVAYLMEYEGVNPYNILAITFTNKAAKEMRERVDNLIDFGAESVWISTFHSMCVRILRKHIDKLGMNKNFTIYDTDEQKAVIKEVLKTLQLDPKMYSEKNMLNKISKCKENYCSPDDYERAHAVSFRDVKIAEVYREYQKRLKSNNALDFDDLIYMTIFLFETNPDVLDEYQERFKYIMVDEYQDTNHTQFLLVKQLASKYRNLCVVGDDDQSIYKFRGANIENILNFKEQYPEATIVKLEQNYRSTANILNAANAVVANNANRTDKKLWTEQDDGEKITYTQYGTGYEEGTGISAKIHKLQVVGVSLDDIAVLYRTNNQSRIIEEKFIYDGIPYKLYGGTNFYDRREIRDMVSYLKVIANMSDDNAIKRIINVPKRGIGDTSVNRASEFAIANGINLYDALYDIEEVPGMSRAADKIKKFVDLIEGFKKMVDDGEKLSDVYDAICTETGYVDELNAEGTDEAKARIENINELKNKVVKYEEDSENPNLIELLEEISLVADVDEVDDDSSKVTLMTLHRAKGLEFPYVFISGMEEGLFPSKLSIESDDPDDLEEERRLCYVGITRAMKKLYLSSANQRMINGTTEFCVKSRFIKEIPKQYVEAEGEFFSSKAPVQSEKVKVNNTFKVTKPYSKTYSGTMTKSGNSANPGFGKVFPMGNKTSEDTKYEVGERVRHLKFGEGVITDITSAGADDVITVNFDRVGEKRMFASLVKLIKL